MNFLAFIMLSALSMSSFSASAATIYKPCHGCSGEQYELKANAAIATKLSGTHIIEIYDLDSGALHSFEGRISYRMEEGVRTRTQEIFAAPSSQEAKSTVIALKALQEEANRSPNTIELPSDFPLRDSFHMVGNTGAQGKVADHIRSNHAVQYWFMKSASIVASFPLARHMVGDVVIRVDIKFPNGTLAKFKIVPEGSFEQASLAFIEAFDANGNKYPNRRDDMVPPLQVNFPSNNEGRRDYGNWADLARRYGIPFVDARPGEGSGNIAMSCEMRGDRWVCWPMLH